MTGKEEIYSRDGIMIYHNGFRIAECENEEAADQILQALSQLSSHTAQAEIKTPQEFAREWFNNSPIYDYKVIADLLQAYHSQFSSPQEVTDEEIYSEAVSWALSTAKEDNDTLLIIRYEAYEAGMKSMRSKLNK